MVAAFALVGPLGGAIGAGLAGLIDSRSTSEFFPAVGYLVVLAYTFGLVPLALAGIVAALLSPRVRGLGLWLVLGALLGFLAAAGVALLLTQDAGGAVGFWQLVVAAGPLSGLLGAAVSSRFRPRRGEPAGGLAG